MTLSKNIFASYAGAGAVALAPILALPWYLSLLGPKLYGLIGFIATLQAIMSLLDVGISQSLIREFTLRLNNGNVSRLQAARLLRSFERIYWQFAIVVLCVAFLVAAPLTSNWLILDDLPLETGRMAVYGAAAIFAAQFPGSLYRSALISAQAQVSLNIAMITGAVLKHAGGVIAISLWPALLTYLVWFFLVTLLETLLRAVMAWRCLGGGRTKIAWSREDVRQIIPIALAMSGASIIGALTVQMDKIILSRMVSVDLFGYYVAAWSVAIGMLQLIYPIMNTVLPRVIMLHKEPKTLRLFCAKLTAIVLLIIIAGGLVFYSFGFQLLNIWLNNSEAVSLIYLPLSILLLGTAMHAIWNVGYLVWLANGNTNKALLSNILALILSISITPILVVKFGLVGAAFGWLIMNVGGMLLSFGWLKCKNIKCNRGESHTYPEGGTS